MRYKYVVVGMIGVIAVRAEAQPARHVGPDAYVRYTSPAQCVQAIDRMDSFFWRDKRKDTLRYAPAEHGLDVTTRDSLRLCAARFSVDKIAPADLVPMLELGLAMQDGRVVGETEARLKKTLASMPVKSRAWVLVKVIDAFIKAQPLQMPKAREYLQMLDALGKDALAERFSGHRLIARRAYDVNDHALVQREYAAAKLMFRDLPPAQQLTLADSLAHTYSGNALSLAVSLGGVAGAVASGAAFDTATIVVLPLTQSGGPYDAALESEVNSIYAFMRHYATAGGKPTKPVRADHWLGSSRDTVFPKPGRVTIVLNGQPRGFSFETIAAIRRLHAEFGTRGLDIVITTYTMGYFGLEVIGDPNQEVKRLKDWFIDHIGVPCMVAVETSQFGRIADGRRRNTKMANEANYHFGVGGGLVGKDGKIIIAYPLDLQTEATYRMRIEEALKAN